MGWSGLYGSFVVRPIPTKFDVAAQIILKTQTQGSLISVNRSKFLISPIYENLKRNTITAKNVHHVQTIKKDLWDNIRKTDSCFTMTVMLDFLSNLEPSRGWVLKECFWLGRLCFNRSNVSIPFQFYFFNLKRKILLTHPHWMLIF